jgi:hypothetical protein
MGTRGRVSDSDNIGCAAVRVGWCGGGTAGEGDKGHFVANRDVAVPGHDRG